VFNAGATSGFGMTTARRFAAAGWRTVITGRRGERLEALKSELPTPCHAAVLDVTDRKAVDARSPGCRRRSRR
jgi:3-hydroxy acid dehydrogenase/malonic semialdehyde reductase